MIRNVTVYAKQAKFKLFSLSLELFEAHMPLSKCLEFLKNGKNYFSKEKHQTIIQYNSGLNQTVFVKLFLQKEHLFSDTLNKKMHKIKNFVFQKCSL